MQENKDDPSNSKNNDGKIDRKEISTNFIILSHNKIINNAEVLYNGLLKQLTLCGIC